MRNTSIPRVREGRRKIETWKHFWILWSHSDVFERNFTKKKKTPVSEVQSKKLAEVMQSFYPERNQFYSYVYVYISNFTPCCLVHCLKKNTSEFSHSLGAFIYKCYSLYNIYRNFGLVEISGFRVKMFSLTKRKEYWSRTFSVGPPFTCLPILWILKITTRWQQCTWGADSLKSKQDIHRNVPNA